MPVVKSKRGEGQLVVFTKASELAAFTVKICSNEKNFPKRYRWCVTGKIVDSVLEIHRCITQANAVYVSSKADYELRETLQKQALSASYAALSLMDVAYRTFNLEENKVENWTGLVIEVQNYLKNWKKSDAERFKEYIG